MPSKTKGGHLKKNNVLLLRIPQSHFYIEFIGYITF